MKETMKRVLSFALVLVLVLSLAVTAFAEASYSPTEGDITVRMNAKKNATVWVPLVYSNQNFTINRADVKVLKGTSGAKLTQFEKYSGSSSYAQWNYISSDNSWQESSYGYKDKYCYYYVGLTVQQAGTATIKYKFNGETHTIKVTVEAYKNPVKTMSLTGYKSGKNFATRAASYKNIKLTANIKNAKLKVTAAKGWVVRSIGITDVTANTAKGVYFRNATAGTGNLVYGQMLRSHKYTIMVQFYNESKYISQTVNYTVN